MESTGDREMKKQYIIKPGAQPIDGVPLVGTTVFAELEHREDNSHFMRVKYSSDEVVCGVVVKAVGRNMEYLEGKHYAVARYLYKLTPAEEYTE